MKFTFYDALGASHLIEDYYEISFSKESVPFETTILPVGGTNLTFIYSGNQKIIDRKKIIPLNGLMLSGQFFRSFKFLVDEPGRSFGMRLKPTTLHKLLHINTSKISDSHIPLSEVHTNFYDQLNPIFLEHKKPEETIEKINAVFNRMPLRNNKNIDIIETVINSIREKEGMLSVEEIVAQVPFTQKTLETQFKQIIGLTPGKYMRLYRFQKLMRKYESKQIEINDLIYMYNYYDHSHFTKDFKLFMQESPKSYFKKDNLFLKKYLIDS